MKKCSKCGALMSDDRNTCIDCGAVLGKPMTDEEEAVVEDSLDDTLDGCAEMTQEFYVPVRDKVMGIISIAAAVVLAGLLIYIGMRGDSAAAVPIRDSLLDKAALYAVVGLFSYAASAVYLLFPKVVWYLETLKYRLWYDVSPSPSYFALLMYKLFKYAFFVIGCIALAAVIFYIR